MNEMDVLYPIPNGQRNADDMGAPPVIAREGTTESMQDPRLVSHADATPPVDQPQPEEAPLINANDYPGHLLQLRESEINIVFPGGLPHVGGIYGLLCVEIGKGEGEDAGKIGVGFRYIKVAEIKGQPDSRIIVPNR